MRQQAISPIPLITADLITASAVIARLTSVDSLRVRCAVIQEIARTGRSVDSLTVGELVVLTHEAQRRVS